MTSKMIRFAVLTVVAFAAALFARVEFSYAAIHVNVSLNNNTPAYSGPLVGIGGQTDPMMFFPHQQIKGVTDDDFATLMSRIKKSGISFARIWIQADWWEPVNDNADPNVMNDAGFTWNSPEMVSLVKYLSALKDAGVDVELDMMMMDPAKMYPWMMWDNWGDALPADDKRAEFAESIAALVKKLVVTEGYTNVKFISLWNEPENIITVPTGKDRLAYYKQVYQDVRSRLLTEGLLSSVKLAGIEVGFYDALGQPWFEDFTKADGLLDAYTTHAGPTIAQLKDGSFSTRVAAWQNMKNTNDSGGSGKPFMFTEMGSFEGRGLAVDGLQFSSAIVDGLRNGVAGFSRWRLYDDWYGSVVGANQTMTASGDFGWGALSGKQEDYTPKQAYYALSLMAKFVPKGSTTYTTASDNSLVVPAIIHTAGGKNTIVAVNWSTDTASVQFNLQNALSTTFKKYQYNENQTMDGLGRFPASIGTKTVSGTSFTDSIPPMTMYVYTDIPDSVAPAQVAGTGASTASKTVNVTWTANTDADLAYYRIYRSTTSGFTPSDDSLIDETWIQSGHAPVYHDRNAAFDTTYYYKVAAVDSSENVGPASAQAAVTTPPESFGNALTVTDNSSGQYYEIASTYDGGYKFRISKTSGAGLYVEDASGISRTNITKANETYPIVYPYDSGAFAEQLANGDAEAGSGTPSGWYNWTSGGGTFLWDSAVRHTGGHSLKVTNTANTQNSTWFQSIDTVTPGASYDFSYWMKTDGVAQTGFEGQGAAAVIQFKDAAGNVIYSTGEIDAKKDTHDWSYNNISVTAPVDAVSAAIQLRIFSSAGTAWFDDVSVTKAGEKLIPAKTSPVVTYSNIDATHKQIATVQGSETLTYDFYPDRIEISVTGPNPGGYVIEDAGYPYRMNGHVRWSDDVVTDMSTVGWAHGIQRSVTSATLEQLHSPYGIRYAFASAKDVTFLNGYRFRGYYPRFWVSSGEVYSISFPRNNAAVNGGFESGTSLPSDWSTWTSGTGTFSWDASVALTGAKSAKIVNGAADSSTWFQEIGSPELGRELELSGWVKSSAVAGTHGAFLAIQARDAAGNVLEEQGTPALTGNQDWKRVSLRFTPPHGTTKLYVGGRLWASSGTAWFDDIVLAPAGNGSVNPGAEMGASTPDGWSTWATSGTPFSWDSAEFKDGSRSLKIVNSAGQYASWNELIPNVQRGKEYAFGGWVKTSGVSGGQGAFITMTAKDFDGNVVQEARTESLTGTNGWTYVHGTIVIPQVGEYLYLEGRLWGSNGSAWFDCFTFKTVRN